MTSEVENTAREMCDLISDHVGKKYREEFTILLHLRLERARKNGVDVGAVWNELFKQLHAARDVAK